MEFSAAGSYRVAYGLHQDPTSISAYHLGDFGWIAETPGGICISDNAGVVRYNRQTLDTPQGSGHTLNAFSMVSSMTGCTLAITVDHECKTITWTKLVPNEASTVYQRELPDELIGTELYPVM